MDTPEELLALGTIVRTGGEKQLMIVARALAVKVDGRQVYFDYGACGYPEGMIGDTMLFFNAEDIVETIHDGFRCELDTSWCEKIKSAAGQSVIVKANTRQLRDALSSANTIGGPSGE